MKTNITEANYLFSDIAVHGITSLIGLMNNYKYVSDAIDHSKIEIVSNELNTFKDLMKNHQIFKDLFNNGSDVTPMGMILNQYNQVQDNLENVKLRAAASSFVFAHAVFENCIHNCLKIIFLVAPESWIPKIEKRNISVKETLENDLQILHENLTKEYLDGLERDSLVKKLNVFLSITKPANNLLRSKCYQYDEARIKSLDKQRHEVIHQDSSAYNPENLNDDIWYLYDTLIHLLNILAKIFNLQNIPRANPN